MEQMSFLVNTSVQLGENEFLEENLSKDGTECWYGQTPSDAELTVLFNICSILLFRRGEFQ
jgi:hypothetical protein